MQASSKAGQKRWLCVGIVSLHVSGKLKAPKSQDSQVYHKELAMINPWDGSLGMEMSNGEKGFVGLSVLLLVALTGAAYVSSTDGILGRIPGTIALQQLELAPSSPPSVHEEKATSKLEALAGPLTRFKASSSSSTSSSFHEEKPASKLELLGGRYSLSVEQLANLDKVLSEAAFHNRTVIITNLNQAWAARGSMVDVFLKSFRVGDGTRHLLKHLVILAMDKASFQRCLLLHSHCFALETEQVDFSGEKLFMSADFVKMMWRRVQFMGLVLELGYNFIFTDSDVLWLRNPFQHLSTSNADLEVACDLFVGDPADPHNAPNTGFLHVRASNRTIQLYRFWHSAKDAYPGLNEQMVLSEIRATPGFQELGLDMRYLPTELFGGFCEAGKDLSKICTMHANCCAGLQNKIKDLRRILNDWKRFKAMAAEGSRMLQGVQWSAPKKCLTSFQRVFQPKHKKKAIQGRANPL